jgi:hypothetical protein
MDAGNRARFARATERVDAAFRHLDTDDPPVVIQDANYSITGEEPDTIPDDYLTRCLRGWSFSARKIVAHLERYDDDYVPFLFPGTGRGRPRRAARSCSARRSRPSRADHRRPGRHRPVPDPCDG